jgi:hypothetical protein
MKELDLIHFKMFNALVLHKNWNRWLEFLERHSLFSVKWRENSSQSLITTDGQSASLSSSQAPIWDPRIIFPLLSLIIFRQLRICWCGAPFLTRSRVCSFQFFLGIASAAFLTTEFHGTHALISLSLFLRRPQPRGSGYCIYFPQDQSSPVIPPDIGLREKSKSKSHYDRQSVLASGVHLVDVDSTSFVTRLDVRVMKEILNSAAEGK